MGVLSLSRSSAVMLFTAGVLAVVALGNLEGTTPAALRAEDVRQQLQGTWLREGNAGGLAVRHVLVLGGDGRFVERVRATDEAGHATNYRHEGTWLYDGTNLKRKYTMINDKPPSRLNVPFATFEISFPSRNEFVGVDHVYGNRIAYRRVGTDEEN